MQWPGFSFSVPMLARLVTLGMRLLYVQGATDDLDRRRVCLRSRRLQLYGEVSTNDWSQPDPDLRVGLFFWGSYRPPRPYLRLPWWTWQTPRTPEYITPKNCYGLRNITDRQIRTVVRFLTAARPISAEELSCARLHLP